MRTVRRQVASCGAVLSVAVPLLAWCGAAGCGSRTPQPVEPEDPPPETAEPRPETGQEQQDQGAIVIVPFQMGDHTGDDVLLHADGTIHGEREDVDFGIVHPDGRFTDLQGNTIATLQPDGTIELAEGGSLDVWITPEGALRHRQQPGLEIVIRDDGSIVGVDSTLEGAESQETFGSILAYTPEAERTALYVLALMSQLLTP